MLFMCCYAFTVTFVNPTAASSSNTDSVVAGSTSRVLIKDDDVEEGGDTTSALDIKSSIDKTRPLTITVNFNFNWKWWFFWCFLYGIECVRRIISWNFECNASYVWCVFKVARCMYDLYISQILSVRIFCCIYNIWRIYDMWNEKLCQLINVNTTIKARIFMILYI